MGHHPQRERFTALLTLIQTAMRASQPARADRRSRILRKAA
jgi:hypothetical protein